MKILVIKTSSLGDVIHCFPAVSVLSSLNPDAEIHWLVNNAFKELVSLHPAVVKVIPFEREKLGHPFNFLGEFLKLCKLLRSERYDIAIDFQGLLRNSLFAYLSSANNVAGFKSPAEKISQFFYDLKIDTSDYEHALEKNCALASRIFGEEVFIPDFEGIKNKEKSESVKTLLCSFNINPELKYLIVAPCGRWESKNWPVSFFVSVLKKVCKGKTNLPVIFVGSDKDKKVCDQICNELNGNCFNFAGKTDLIELLELIRGAKLMFCVDSGPMHMAAALSIPVCALFGPTDPLKTGPYGKIHKVFQSGTCIKCLRRYCSRSSETCHSSINYEEVAEFIINKLEGQK
ncbi:MAG TPA: glycosyltransferase family 9 protein [Victivallales bacterium]|nr:glycosyltransferase family 9 protein [Victivallales bacterium]HPO90176.1 glycosyltransferase family 9 protein [Victivallales bacterium]HRR06895.1 glycosyltransferase family 9 protein [Victivallales bacterium]HRU00071.1 glycosyltransferase family 9 protein [Victivallales bacterium]